MSSNSFDTSVRDARRAKYVGFLHRHPFATDAYELGFAPGVREDYRYRTDEYPNVELPVIILDNDFRDPDVDRYLDRFDRYDPSVAILGDAYTGWAAERYQGIVDGLREEHPYKEYVVVPKCASAFDRLDDSVTLGLPMGYSDETWDEYSDLADWRGRDVHLLGGNPHRQYEAIQRLTQPTVTGDPPADVVGMDWNGPHKGALMGKYWTADGWQRADHLSIRDTVRKSLKEIKRFWKGNGVWPETDPVDLYGPAVAEPDEHVFMDRGGGPIGTRDELEAAYVEEYENYGTMAFESELQKKHWENYEGLTSVDG